MLKFLPLFAAALFLIAGPAVAAPDDLPAPAERGGRAPSGLMRYDTNKDGVVDRAEWKAGQEARFKRLDANGDGKLTLAYTATNEKPKQELYNQLHSMLAKLRMEPGHLFHRFAYMKNEIPVAGVAHQAGTCRMGADPASSALNADCRAHELDNLYVVDTSVFPSIGAVNPALTAMANSLRVGDRLLERLDA